MSTATATKPATTNKNESKADAKAPETNKENTKVEATKQEETKAPVVEAPKATYEELFKKFEAFTLTDEEEKTFNEMRKAKRQEVQGRLNSIAEAVKLITANKITLSELVDNNVFSQDQIKMEAESYYPSFAKPKRGPKPAGADGETKGTKTPKDYGMELFKIKVAGQKGKGTTIAEKTPFPAESVKFGAGFQHVKDMGGNALTNLKKFAIQTPEVEEYLKSEEGHKIAEKWAGWISRGGKKA